MIDVIFVSKNKEVGITDVLSAQRQHFDLSQTFILSCQENQGVM